MARCVTCGVELHPERAEKYNYCTRRECQEENFKGLTMLAIGVNKSADQYQILDERTRKEMADGKYRDQRRTSFGKQESSRREPAPTAERAPQPNRPRRTPPRTSRRAWSRSQENLALIYNANGMRPDEIAKKLGVSTYVVSQIILAARNRAKP